MTSRTLDERDLLLCACGAGERGGDHGYGACRVNGRIVMYGESRGDESDFMACGTCGVRFDLRDLTQVLFHETHRPTPVLNVGPGIRVPSLPVREPDPWRGCRFEEEARRQPVMCPGCGEVAVSAEDQHCAECEIEHTCANCGGRIDPGDVYCDEGCRSEAEAYAAGDARNDLEEGA